MNQETEFTIQNSKALALFPAQAARNPRLIERSFATAFGIICSA
jgi:hypothetical protein